jgi:branched-chain amino acid transport system permease protein
VAEDLVPLIWGPEDLLGPRAPGLKGAVEILGRRVPEYDLFLIALGPVVLAALWLLLTRTRWGLLVRAATEDRTMVAALGTDQRWLFTGVFALGALLAGLGGALILPREAVHHDLDIQVITEAFVVVVVGGMGSLPGAYLAAMLLGVVNAFGVALFPQATLVTLGLAMMVVLALRPQGLLGRLEPEGATSPVGPGPILRPALPRERLAWTVFILIAAAAPAILGGYGLSVLAEGLILALGAASLQLLMGPGGLVSFGHAAYFGLGAYGVALATVHLDLPFPLALACAPLLGGLGGLLVGWFVTRLSGVYLAMLTLAFAEVLRAVAIQWVPVTGGDNGLIGVRPPEGLGAGAPYWWLVLTLCGGGLVALRALVLSPFGQRLRAGRDADARAEASGIRVVANRWAAFALAGAFAGLAGGLFTLLKGGVFPTVAGVQGSVDFLVMVLLGGVHAPIGPLLGAAAYTALELLVSTQTDQWRMILGGVILLLALAYPGGLSAALAGWRRRP